MLILLSLSFASSPDLSGRWAISHSSAALDALHQETLDEGLAALPWAFRPFARGPLTGTIRTCRDLTLSLTEEVFRVECPEFDVSETYPREAATRRISGTDGKMYDVSLSVESDAVRVTWAGSSGGKTFVYRVVDGQLVQRQEVFSSQLSEPIVWEAPYQRQPS